MSKTTEAAAHVAGLLRQLSEQPPVDSPVPLSALTWRVAMLTAAQIVEEDAAIRATA